MTNNRTLPAEWEPQDGVQLTWPNEDTDWGYVLDEVVDCFTKIAKEIAKRENLLIVAKDAEKAREALAKRLTDEEMAKVRYVECPINDTWTRDHGFITVKDGDTPTLLDFQFNGWGDKFEAKLDNQINAHIVKEGALKGKYESHLDFVLEGGSIESDGKGTLMTTCECLLSQKRNTGWSKDDIEEKLKTVFGAKHVLWLNHGALEGDDTDSHIDTLARLCPDDTIAYVKCADTTDSHYDQLLMMEKDIKAMRTANGKPFRLIQLPMPLSMFAYQPGENSLERLPATYANFLVINGAVLCPTYNQPKNDAAALEALQEAFPDHKIVGINCSVLVKQHGSLHCSAMQFPKGTF